MHNYFGTGQRHIVFGQGMWLKEIAQILAKEFKPQGYSVPTLGCPTFATKMIGFINKDIKAMLPHVGKVNKLENNRVRKIETICKNIGNVSYPKLYDIYLNCVSVQK